MPLTNPCGPPITFPISFLQIKSTIDGYVSRNISHLLVCVSIDNFIIGIQRWSTGKYISLLWWALLSTTYMLHGLIKDFYKRGTRWRVGVYVCMYVFACMPMWVCVSSSIWPELFVEIWRQLLRVSSQPGSGGAHL